MYMCIYMKEYYLTIKIIESCHSRQHGWTLWTLCLKKQFGQRKANTIWPFLYEKSKINK